MTKKKIKIEISAVFGSKFQETFAIDTLNTTMEGWKKFCNDLHKKNKIETEINIVGSCKACTKKRPPRAYGGTY